MSRRLNGLRVALRSILRRNRVEQELNEEFQYHIDRQTAEGIAAGLTPDDARAAALKSMGAVEKSKEECRDVRSGNAIEDAISDLRYAGRGIRRNPGFAALAIGIMALGIGANTAVFSVVNAVLLQPLPYPEADRIVVLRTAFHTRGETQTLVSIANFRDWRDHSSSFEAMSSYRPGENAVSADATAQYGRVASVDAQFFRVFGVEPAIGRTFRAEETGPDAPRNVVISYRCWQSQFAGDPRILERTIRVGATARTIIGVMPAGFQFPGRTDVWLPQTTSQTSRTGHNFYAVGRLKPGVSLERGQADLSAVAAALEQQYPDSNQGRGVTAVPLHDELVGDVRLTLYLLWGVVALVLLIACVNTATLLLGKATARTRELALRATLGASRTRIMRQLITESLVMAMVAGIAGLVMAYWGSRVLAALSPFEVVRSAGAGVDVGVLTFTLAVSAATSVIFGLVPALHASRIELADATRQGGTRSIVGGRAVRTRSVLVVSEVALAVVLLTGAGLLTKSLIALDRVALGFQPANTLVMKATGMQSRRENDAFFGNLLSRIAALPGVTAVGATSTPPGDLSIAGSGSHHLDRLPPPSERDRSDGAFTMLTIVAPGSFAALGIPLKSGRDFNDGDSADAPLVAIVNEALVRKSAGAGDPIGRSIFCSFDRNDPMTIVGVVGDARQRNPAIAPVPECYMPYRQHQYNSNTLNVLIRTIGDPSAQTATVRRVAAELSPQVPVSFTTMENLVADGVADPRFRTLLFVLFAGLALCLALAGVYGVMAYAVAQRTAEIGVRMALGASQGSVLQLILRHGLALTTVGLALGVLGAIAATQLLEAVLFEVRPLDGAVYLAVVAMIGAGTLLAGYVPAWRATRVDPVVVLKAH